MFPGMRQLPTYDSSLLGSEDTSLAPTLFVSLEETS